MILKLPNLVEVSLTPILIVAWRRPASTELLINSLRGLEPTNLFIACDGPRENNHNDYLLVEKTREIIKSKITWNCSISYKYNNVNMGCRRTVSEAISWFLSEVEFGIILEDDCIPNPKFMSIATLLLDYYRDDTRVATIGGCNPVTWLKSSEDIVFSRYFECWGWATWRRAWKFYDDSLSLVDITSKNNLIHNSFLTKQERRFWNKLAKQLLLYDSPSSWAYRFQITCAIQNMVHAICSPSLITNVGNDEYQNAITGGFLQKVYLALPYVIDKDPETEILLSVPPTVLPDLNFDYSYASLHGITIPQNPFTKIYKALKRRIQNT